MSRHHVIVTLIFAAAIALALACGSSDSGPNKPIEVKSIGTTDQIWLNVCRKGLGDYVYDDCTDSAAKAACLEFQYDSAVNHICSTQTCDSYQTTFMVSVTCWKPSSTPAPALPDSVVDSVVHLGNIDR